MTDQEQVCAKCGATKSGWRIWLPHLLVVLWLLFLGITIWLRATHSVQRPYHDPLSYMQKAANFWRLVESGRLFNPLNIDFVVRPPGTILMSYPFGLTPDYYGFYFRSVFLPILSTVIAVYMMTGLARARASGWQVAAMAFLFSSLPMFYSMDWGEGSFGWGMVDAFQGGIAAMAMAAILRSQTLRSLRWLLSGALLASFTVLVKPSGLMVMALAFFVWLMMAAQEWWFHRCSQSEIRSIQVYAWRGGLIFLVVYISVVLLCINSRYFSPQNFNFAHQALAVMKRVLTADSFLPLLHRSSGEFLPLWTAGVCLLLFRQWRAAAEEERRTLRSTVVLLLCSFFTWIAGAWYWIVVQAGLSQYRFFFPFLLMGCICLVSPALHVWPRMRTVAGGALMLVCILPAANMALLLAAGDSPSRRWQAITGVNVSVGGGRGEIAQAYAFLEKVRKEGKDRKIYFFSSKMITDTSFALIGDYEKILRPELASFSNAHPLSWSRGFAVRIHELLSCDHILVYKHSPENIKRFLVPAAFSTFESERLAFEGWFSLQSRASGLETVSDGPRLRLMRIADFAALNRAIDQFIAAHRWRPEFYEANPPLWWDPDTIKNAAPGKKFGTLRLGALYELHTLSVNRTAKDLHVDIWWNEILHDEANAGRYLFFHLIDKSGNIKYNKQLALFPYAPPYPERKWRYGTVTFRGVLPDDDLVSIGLGEHRSGNVSLSVESALPTEWEGRRALIPLHSIPETGTQKD